ncbi:hypothetical protein [Priestia megaterium]|uniref:hypothetical protein n=1 Tax=Priestia megaterium TaxID=1404 RepID=UPI00203F5420|nr:hypothetical protein [Priestia megaterium]MCM3096500.1 hypothetical protein [Priestia megaterium]
MENMILKHMDVVRGITISILEKTTEEAADITPKGFNNNIRWKTISAGILDTLPLFKKNLCLA